MKGVKEDTEEDVANEAHRIVEEEEKGKKFILKTTNLTKVRRAFKSSFRD